jgi:hypothetical protein
VCPGCGAEIPAATAAPAQEADLTLTWVPPDQREAVRNFDEQTEAEIAGGFLRAQGIPAELSSEMIPGLAYNIALWVPRDYLDIARRLLDEADTAASTATESD